jgi:hypothetical protein
MTFEAHEMRASLVFASSSLFHIFSCPSLSLDLALVEANATYVTIASFVVQHMLEGDLRVVAPL